MKPSDYEISKLSMKIMYTGLAIDIAGAVGIFIIALLLNQWGMVTSVPADQLKVLGYALLGMSLLELIIIFVLKRKWFSISNPMIAKTKSFKKLSAQLYTLYIILYFIALSPAIYGFLYYILGGVQDMLVLMMCVTFIGYMFIRPKPAFLQELFGAYNFEDL